MTKILGLLIVFPFLLFSQVQEKERVAFKRHFLEVSPLALTMKEGYSFNQHLEYRFLITQNLYLKAGSTLTLARQLDYNRNSGPGIRPLFNESFFDFGYQHAFNQLTETNRRVNLIGVDLGYHYMQYGTSPQSGDDRIVDSTAQGFRMLGGYKVHSMKAGLNFQHIVYTDELVKPEIKSRHFLGLNFLYGADFQLSSYILTSSNSAVKADNLEGHPWRSRFGGKIEYTFEHLISKRIGMIYGCNFTWAPWAKYTPNEQYYVPRGGELTLPSALTFRVGITIQ
jgi:hypothetical protein